MVDSSTEYIYFLHIEDRITDTMAKKKQILDNTKKLQQISQSQSVKVFECIDAKAEEYPILLNYFNNFNKKSY